MKIERTFIFVALMALAILGYGLTGAFIFGPQEKAKCVDDCKKIAAEVVDACLFNDTYYKKDFFIMNVCKPGFEQECEQQFCGPAVNLPPEKVDQCNKLCSR